MTTALVYMGFFFYLWKVLNPAQTGVSYSHISTGSRIHRSYTSYVIDDVTDGIIFKA